MHLAKLGLKSSQKRELKKQWVSELEWEGEKESLADQPKKKFKVAQLLDLLNKSSKFTFILFE